MKKKTDSKEFLEGLSQDFEHLRKDPEAWQEYLESINQFEAYTESEIKDSLRGREFSDSAELLREDRKR